MDEDGVVDGYYDPVIQRREPEEFAPPYEPLCSIGRSFAFDPDLTVEMYSQALSQHKAICPFCRRLERKSVGREEQADRKGKVA